MPANALIDLLRKPLAAGRDRLRRGPVRRWVVDYRHRGIEASDVLLASYPKSGNTWLRHMVTQLVTGEATDWRGRLQEVSNMVGRHRGLPRLLPGGGRLIKTHEAYRPEYRRALLLVRDGRDAAVSEYHYQRDYVRNASARDLSFDEFLDAFLAGGSNGYGAWHTHVASWIEASRASGADVTLICYEDLKRDPHLQMTRVAEAVGVDADEQAIARVVEDNSLEAMRSKEARFWAERGVKRDRFVRSGKAGGWRAVFDASTHDRFLATAGHALDLCGYDTDFTPADAHQHEPGPTSPLPR